MTSVLPVIVVVVVVVLMSCCFVLFCFFFCRKHNYDTELPAARLTLVLKELFFLGGVDPPKKLEGFVWGFLSITGLRSQRQFAPKCSLLTSRPLGHCSFRISGQIS